MKTVIVCYPKCTTCKRAEAFLKSIGVQYVYRNIKEDRPSEEELREWHEKSGLPLKKLFNTSGMLYREIGLSTKLAEMDEDETFALLAADGMLVKRPVLLAGDKVIFGFKESEWRDALKA